MKIYVINLYNAHRRRMSVEEEFNRQKLNYEIFYGINSEMLRRMRPTMRLSHGAIGCFLSHVAVLQNAMQQKEDVVMIAEDDIQLSERFSEHLDDCLNSAPEDWEVIFLSWFKGRNAAEVPVNGSNKWLSIKNALGASSYVVKRAAIPKILNEVRVVKDHFDKQLVDSIEAGRIKGYWRKDRISTTKPFKTQIPK